MTVTVLMVAEKPMLAESIAKLLSDNQANKRKGWNGACSVSEYMGSFMGQNARFKVFVQNILMCHSFPRE